MKEQNLVIETDAFKGIFTNVAPDKVPIGGALTQQNMRSQLYGQLDVRPGMKPVTFGNTTTSTSNSVISMYQYPAPLGNVVVYEDSAGNVKIGRSPTVS